MIRRIEWNESVAAAFAPITYDGGKLESQVKAGEIELWHVAESDCSGYLATEVFPDMLFIWCFAGRGGIALLRRVGQLARSNGLSRVGFFSMHAATRRVVGPYAEISETEIAGEYRFYLNSEHLCELPATLPERLQFAQSAVTQSPRSQNSLRL